MSFYSALMQLRRVSSVSTFVVPHLRRTRKFSFREKVHKTLTDPRVSPLALLYAIVIVCSILASLASFFCSTLPRYWNTPVTYPQWLFGLEVTTTAIFTFDYLAQLLTVPKPYKWMFEPMSLIDFFSTTTLYIELILQAAGVSNNVVSLFRVLRSIRIIKLGRFSPSFQVLTRVIRTTSDGLFMMMLLYGIGLATWSTLIFFAEQTSDKGQHFDSVTETWIRADGSTSPFQSIIDCFWWSMTTMSTTGYGDTFPYTPLGKFVAGCATLYGIIMIAFPIAVFGNAFHREWKQFQVSKLEDEMELLTKEKERTERISRYTHRELGNLARESLMDYEQHVKEWKERISEWANTRETFDNMIIDLKGARRKRSYSYSIKTEDNVGEIGAKRDA